MATREIARDDWAEFFTNFSRAHKGWLINVQLLSPALGAQVEVRELPLDGIIAETNDVNAISFVIGEAADSHLNRTIEGPTHVRLSQTKDGERETLQIESAEGTTLVQLRPAVLSECATDVIIE